MYHNNKKEKGSKKKRRRVPQKADEGGSTALHTSLKKSCRGKLRKKILRAMIGSFEKSKKMRMGEV